MNRTRISSRLRLPAPGPDRVKTQQAMAINRRFAIWDSRIYRFIYEQAPHQNRVNNARAYERYLGILQTLRQDVRFPTFHASINRKMGYPVSASRAIEVVMFLKAPRVGFNASAEQ